MGKVRTAVIGVGSLGQHHARICRQLPNVELVAVADVLEERAKEIGLKNSVPWVTDYRELLPDIDAACLVVPTVRHFDIASDLISAGKSVLVEKPMTATLAEADALCRLAQESDVTLQVGHIERFNPVMQAVDECGITPLFIESHRLSPYKFRSSDVGVVLDLMIHDLDIILHLTDSPIESVDAVGVNIIGASEDIANVRIRFQSGCVANITASRCALKTIRKMRIFGPEGYIGLDFGKTHAMLVTKSGAFDAAQYAVHGRSLADPCGATAGFRFEDLLDVKEIELNECEPLVVEIESFANCVLDGVSPVVCAADGRKAIEAAEKVLESIRSNAWFAPKG